MTLVELRWRGFEKSRPVPFTRNYIVECDSCEAVSINGRPCHEHGCPKTPVECRECGQLGPRGEVCCAD